MNWLVRMIGCSIDVKYLEEYPRGKPGMADFVFSAKGILKQSTCNENY